MADEKRAGPWVEDQGEWVRRLQEPSQFAAWVFYSTTQERWAWHASVAAIGHAPTPEAARAAADEVLRAEGWTLEEEPTGASEYEVALRVMTGIWPEIEQARRAESAEPSDWSFTITEVRDLRPEETGARVSMPVMPPDPNAPLDIVRTTATPGRQWSGDDLRAALDEIAEARYAAADGASEERQPDMDRLRALLYRHPEFTRPGSFADADLSSVARGQDHSALSPPAPVVSIIRRWAADRDAGRDIGEGASVLLDELLETVGTGRPVAPPVTEARGRLVAGAWVLGRDGHWVRPSADRNWPAARVWDLLGLGVQWRWRAEAGHDAYDRTGGRPTPEAARQAADAALRAAGWELQ